MTLGQKIGLSGFVFPESNASFCNAAKEHFIMLKRIVYS